MATSKPTITKITDSFTEFKDNLNRVSLDVGATGRLNTNQDSDLTSAINELELAIRGTSNDLVATDLSQAGITANNIVSALVELDIDIHGSWWGYCIFRPNHIGKRSSICNQRNRSSLRCIYTRNQCGYKRF